MTLAKRPVPRRTVKDLPATLVNTNGSNELDGESEWPVQEYREIMAKH